MPQSQAGEGATTGGQNGGDAQPEVVHRTRSALGKRERAKSPTPERDAEADVELDRAKLAKLLDKTESSLKKKLNALENTIGDMEEDYIVTTWSNGNVLRGWDIQQKRPERSKNTGNGAGSATGAPKHRKQRPTDRWFSLSSATSPMRKDLLEQIKIKNQKKKKKR